MLNTNQKNTGLLPDNLGEEQLEALANLSKFVNGKELSYLVSGYAGTGKTTIMKIFIEYLESIRKPYCLCAPTHKAKIVLEEATKRSTITLHKLLSLTPNIEILELDLNSLQFITKGKANGIPSNGIVICDEASMINDGLFDLLNERCKEINSKIIFLGDIAQLSPIKEDTSKVFSVKNCSTLTKIYRQADDNIILNTLITLRNSAITKFENAESKEGSIICADINNFVRCAIDKYKVAIENADILETKILAYTNKRVFNFNTALHRYLFSEDLPYYKGEFLTGYENIDTGNSTFYNSMDYVITETPIKVDLSIPEFGTLPSWQLSLYDRVTKEVNMTNILCPDIEDSQLDKLASTIEYYRLNAIQCRNRNVARKYWRYYYEILNSFTSPKDLYFNDRLVRKKSFDYGYACTVHKSQGSTYNNVFVDIHNFKKCVDPKERRQLQYVALSRTKHDIIIFQ